MSSIISLASSVVRMMNDTRMDVRLRNGAWQRPRGATGRMWHTYPTNGNLTNSYISSKLTNLKATPTPVQHYDT
jgi:hypothetical protein